MLRVITYTQVLHVCHTTRWGAARQAFHLLLLQVGRGLYVVLLNFILFTGISIQFFYLPRILVCLPWVSFYFNSCYFQIFYFSLFFTCFILIYFIYHLFQFSFIYHIFCLIYFYLPSIYMFYFILFTTSFFHLISFHFVLFSTYFIYHKFTIHLPQIILF
jgi:hypothetical protein